MQKEKTSTRVLIAVCAVFLLLGTGFTSQAIATKDVVYVQEGILYHAPKEKTDEKKAVVSGVERIVDHKETLNKLLYITPLGDPDSDTVKGGNLILLDTDTWVSQRVSSNTVNGNLSPDGKVVAAWNNKHEVHLLQSDGKPIKKVGKHGAVPLFSHNGRLLAYEKLADESFDDSLQSLFEDAEGIAIYDMVTDQETLITNGGADDFAPIGFSLDMTKLFFNSARPYRDDFPQNHVASLWVVDITNGSVKRLTNDDEQEVQKGKLVPVVHQNALWTSDRTIVISSNGAYEGIWIFRLMAGGDLLRAQKVADGDMPQWYVPNESILYRVIKSNKTEWKSLKVK